MSKNSQSRALRMIDADESVRTAYRLRLEVEYRARHGIEFQRLFDQIMRSIHKDDYVSVTSSGKSGDLGCDGHLRSRTMYFAVYGPNPYFKFAEAARKMRADFEKFLASWGDANAGQAWYFVINYPDVPAPLLQVEQELRAVAPAVDIRIWSRYDLTQQFLLYSTVNKASAEFGEVTRGSRALAPLAFVPETTELPRSAAQLAHRRYWTRLTCNKKEFEKATKRWLASLTDKPYDLLLVHTQMLLAAWAIGIDLDVYNPDSLSLEEVALDAGLDPDDQTPLLRAWGLAQAIFYLNDQDDPPHKPPPFSGETEDVVVQMAEVCMYQDRITLSIIREVSRRADMWETDVLDELWTWAAERIVIHAD